MTWSSHILPCKLKSYSNDYLYARLYSRSQKGSKCQIHSGLYIHRKGSVKWAETDPRVMSTAQVCSESHSRDAWWLQALPPAFSPHLALVLRHVNQPHLLWPLLCHGAEVPSPLVKSLYETAPLLGSARQAQSSPLLTLFFFWDPLHLPQKQSPSIYPKSYSIVLFPSILRDMKGSRIYGFRYNILVFKHCCSESVCVSPSLASAFLCTGFILRQQR